ncbi:aa3-type cytochrome c oxidase subunit IV [Chenggangzhangella methanolivorans]|uniref:Aa3-type cytochrome c oxidase subunit IV n=1 Tax=Chenggangzhangella methanolivorans TaxID=1437009 RepID=A0A9E6UKG8_9HYPH|nr:aa3-type cytochrome c oxidase subunit IV [Chenggangzhangella methanolivorans]QZN99296.1 aa3-type cytochrome c oxidase subunit IV [Chenggangzhangella methanolivorans]
MAEHAPTEYATATGNDYAEHEGTYSLVMKLSKVATAAVILIVISLGIGGVTGHWGLCGLGVVAALVTGVIGGLSEKGTILPTVVAGVAVVGLWLLIK